MSIENYLMDLTAMQKDYSYLNSGGYQSFKVQLLTRFFYGFGTRDKKIAPKVSVNVVYWNSGIERHLWVAHSRYDQPSRTFYAVVAILYTDGYLIIRSDLLMRYLTAKQYRSFYYLVDCLFSREYDFTVPTNTVVYRRKQILQLESLNNCKTISFSDFLKTKKEAKNEHVLSKV